MTTLTCFEKEHPTLLQAWAGCMMCIMYSPRHDRASYCAGAEPADVLKRPCHHVPASPNGHHSQSACTEKVKVAVLSLSTPAEQTLSCRPYIVLLYIEH